jgi:hypothetical protein
MGLARRTLGRQADRGAGAASLSQRWMAPVRIQTREDGVIVDQIARSSERYLSQPPGPARNDRTILIEHPERED